MSSAPDPVLGAPPAADAAALGRLVHDLNQRYRREWGRAERLQAELNDIRRSRAWRVLEWLRSWKRRLLGRVPVPTTVGAAEFLVTVPPSAIGRVSIVIPFRDQEGLLQNLLRSLRLTSYRRFELILVDNGSSCPRVGRLLKALPKRRRARVVRIPGAFNFARLCNAGAQRARGDFLLFLNNDTEVIEPGWLGEMLRVAAHPEVGVVGATLLYPDRTIQHAGIFPQTDGTWSHVYRHCRADDPGNGGELRRIRVVPAVTGACFLIARRLFESVGGFDESLPLTGNDVELCLRVGRLGYRTAITPEARLLHFESLSRGYAVEPVPEGQSPRSSCGENQRPQRSSPL
ncbi:MAG: glycosyltransferase family 2 protein [Gemmataceae bacterium]